MTHLSQFPPSTVQRRNRNLLEEGPHFVAHRLELCGAQERLCCLHCLQGEPFRLTEEA